MMASLPCGLSEPQVHQGIFKMLADPAWVQGIGSLLAVVVAIWIAFSQKAASAKQVAEARLAEHRADRSLILFALHDLRSYAGKEIRDIATLLRTNSDNQISVPVGWRSSVLPEAGLRDIAKCVSTSPAPSIATSLSEVLKWTQIQHARTMRMKEKAGSSLISFEVASHLSDACRLAVMTDACFAYARFQRETITFKVDRDRIEQAAFQEGVTRGVDAFKDFFFIIDRDAY